MVVSTRLVGKVDYFANVTKPNLTMSCVANNQTQNVIDDFIPQTQTSQRKLTKEGACQKF